jgi:beta-mannan synthase
MMVGIYILCCASYNLVFGKTVLYIYLYMQALAFIIAGIGFIGT